MQSASRVRKPVAVVAAITVTINTVAAAVRENSQTTKRLFSGLEGHVAQLRGKGTLLVLGQA